MGLETDIQSQFEATRWGRRLAQKRLRADLTDFGRFKLAIAKQKRNRIIATKVAAKLSAVPQGLRPSGTGFRSWKGKQTPDPYPNRWGGGAGLLSEFGGGGDDY